MRENCPIWLWRNGQTIDSDTWFWRLSVKIFKRFVWDIFLTFNGIEWRLKIWFLMAKYTHFFFRKQNNVKTPSSEMKMLASQYIETVWRFFCMQAELLKTKFNLVSLSFYSNDHRRISLPHPLPFESVFWGYVHLRHSYGRIIHGDR